MLKRILLLLLCCLLLTGCTRTQELCLDIAVYPGDCARIGNAGEIMPKLSELGDYQDVKYTWKQTTALIFRTEALGLFVRYDQEEYAAQKETLLSTLAFIDEPVMDSWDDDVLLAGDFMYRGYLMKAMPDSAGGLAACKSFMLVGFNDETRSIAYLYHYDQDLDYIAKDGEDPVVKMQGLIDEYFLWQDE